MTKIEDKAFGKFWIIQEYAKGFRVFTKDTQGSQNEKGLMDHKDLQSTLSDIIHRRVLDEVQTCTLKDYLEKANQINKEVMEAAGVTPEMAKAAIQQENK